MPAIGFLKLAAKLVRQISKGSRERRSLLSGCRRQVLLQIPAAGPACHVKHLSGPETKWTPITGLSCTGKWHLRLEPSRQICHGFLNALSGTQRRFFHRPICTGPFDLPPPPLPCVEIKRSRSFLLAPEILWFPSAAPPFTLSVTPPGPCNAVVSTVQGILGGARVLSSVACEATAPSSRPLTATGASYFRRRTGQSQRIFFLLRQRF